MISLIWILGLVRVNNTGELAQEDTFIFSKRGMACMATRELLFVTLNKLPVVPDMCRYHIFSCHCAREGSIFLSSSLFSESNAMTN